MKILAICFTAIVLAQVCLAGTISFTIDTSPLNTSLAGPFSIDFQFIDGSGTGDSNNALSIGSFGFGSGNPFSLPLLTGDAQGSLSTQISMGDAAFFNEFSQGFIPGTSLNFQVVFTSNVDIGGVPDEFSFAILDSTGTEIPTQGLAVVGADIFLALNIDSSTSPSVQWFASDPTRSPAAGGPPIDLGSPAVTVSTTPEPSSFAMAVSGLGGILWHRLRRNLSSRQSNQGRCERLDCRR